MAANDNTSGENTKKRASRKFLIIYGVVGIFIAALIFSTVYFYLQYQKTSQLLGNTGGTLSPQETAALVQKVGSLIELPKEAPTIATVSNVEKLASQPFFKSAQNGDKVLIFQKSKEIILYRPSLNKIINVAPLDISSAKASGNPVPSVTASALSPTPLSTKVELYNGTKTVGITKTVEKDLTAKDASVSIVGSDTAHSQNYTKTVVVDLTGNRADEAGALATIVHGTVATLPAGETKPKADFLVIVGADYPGK